MERVHGIETEYGLGFSLSDSENERETVLNHLLRLGQKRFPHLRAVAGNGLFLANGAKLLIDAGGHPEYCTPETNNPWDAVCFAQAGDEILRQLVSAMPGEMSEIRELSLFKCNVDYQLTENTWACHENYGHRADPSGLPLQLIPHLVSRIVFTGAGGLNPFNRGIEVCLSPRVTHLRDTISSSSTSNRGIYHVKDESLAGPGWRRLHVLCGDTVCAAHAAALKIGTTSLVVAMIEAGLNPGQDVQLANPLAAIRLFNTDLTAQARVPTQGGTRITALEIQRHYHKLAETNLGHPCMPSWADRVCRDWNEMLDRLARNGIPAGNDLDWTVKHALFQQHCEARGFDSSALRFWNWLLLLPDLPYLDLAHRHPPDAEVLSSLPERWHPQVQRLAPELKTTRYTWGQLAQFFKLRGELCEIDLRYGQVHPAGIYQRLTEKGVLRQALPELAPARIQDATQHPPQGGRARVRGDFIRQHSGSEQFKCDWHLVCSTRGTAIDLADPLQAELPPWRPTTDPEAHPEPFQEDVLYQDRLNRIRRLYEQGNFEQAHQALESIRQHPRRLLLYSLTQSLHLHASIQCRRGFFDDSLRSFQRLRDLHGLTFGLVVDFIHLHRFGQLQPDLAAMENWIHRGDEMLQRSEDIGSLERFAFQEHRAHLLWRTGRLTESQAVLDPLSHDSRVRGLAPRFLARALVDLAIVHGGLGNLALARRLLVEADLHYRRGNYHGDLADLALTIRARLEPDRTEADRLLAAAEAIQVRSHNHLGLARTLLMQARGKPSAPGNDARKARLLELKAALPCLQHSPFLESALTRWDLWTEGSSPPGQEDRYWGL